MTLGKVAIVLFARVFNELLAGLHKRKNPLVFPWLRVDFGILDKKLHLKPLAIQTLEPLDYVHRV